MAAQQIEFGLELFGGSFPLLGPFFPVIAASPGIVSSILKRLGLGFELPILGFPKLHTRFEPLRREVLSNVVFLKS